MSENRHFHAGFKYLIGRRRDLADYDQHLVFFGTPSRTSGLHNDLDLALYLNRAVTHCTFHSDTGSYVFTKLCRIVIVGTLKDTLRQWRGTRINTTGGVFTFGEQVVSGVMFKWIEDDVCGVQQARGQISDRQHGILDKALKKYFAEQ